MGGVFACRVTEGITVMLLECGVSFTWKCQ